MRNSLRRQHTEEEKNCFSHIKKKKKTKKKQITSHYYSLKKEGVSLESKYFFTVFIFSFSIEDVVNRSHGAIYYSILLFI